MMRKMVIDAIRTDPAWNGGEYRAPPLQGLRAALDVLFALSSSPLTLQGLAPTRDAADDFFEQWMNKRLRSTDANDYLYAFEASRDYDPQPALEKIEAQIVAINFADDLINPPELGILEREIKRVKRGRAVLVPISKETRGHGTHSLPAVWKEYLAELLSAH
jgi:homoserine O-acetyltransferase